MRYELTIHFERRRHLPSWFHRRGLRWARWLPDTITYMRLTGWTEQGEEAEMAELVTGGTVGRRPDDWENTPR